MMAYAGDGPVWAKIEPRNFDLVDIVQLNLVKALNLKQFCSVWNCNPLKYQSLRM